MDYEHNYYPAQAGHPPTQPQTMQQPPPHQRHLLQQQQPAPPQQHHYQHHQAPPPQQQQQAPPNQQQQQQPPLPPNQQQQQQQMIGDPPLPLQMQPQQHQQNFMGPGGPMVPHNGAHPPPPPPPSSHYAQQNNHHMPGHSPIGTPHSSPHHPIPQQQQQPPPPSMQTMHPQQHVVGPHPPPPPPNYVQQNHNHHPLPGQSPINAPQQQPQQQQHNHQPHHHHPMHHTHPHQPPHQHQHPHQQAPPPHSIPPMHHAHHLGQPPPSPSYMTHNNVHHNPHSYERVPTYYQNIPQTEFRIIELNKRLQRRPKFRGPACPLPIVGSSEESYWWERFAAEFFDDDATLTLRISPDDKPVEYTIGRTLIPRFFKSYFDGGVVDLSIKIRNARETTTPSMILLECDQTDITSKYNYKHAANHMPMNIVVHTEGHLNLEFVTNSYDQLQIKSWRFYTHQCHEYIDRSVTSTGVPNAILVEPVTRHGLTTSTISYLKMCMIMEPMQELMLQHRHTKLDPRTCLKQLLFNKYKLKSVDVDNRPKAKRRRTRGPAAGGNAGANKKTKATNSSNNNNNTNNNNNMCYNNIDNNSLMSPSTGQLSNLSLATQDVMVVGEPSMLGADFGDENERRITRLENNQYDASLNNNTNNNNNTNSENMEHGLVTN